MNSTLEKPNKKWMKSKLGAIVELKVTIKRFFSIRQSLKTFRNKVEFINTDELNLIKVISVKWSQFIWSNNRS